MPVYVYALINAILVLLVGGAVIGLQLWSILTQHRDPGCENVRLRLRRIRISVRLTPLERVPTAPLSDTERGPHEVLVG